LAVHRGGVSSWGVGVVRQRLKVDLAGRLWAGAGLVVVCWGLEGGCAKRPHQWVEKGVGQDKKDLFGG
jgi:hypothetical protein